MYIYFVVLKYFGYDVVVCFLLIIDEVFCEVEVGSVYYGLVLVENLLEGVVNYILDCFKVLYLNVIGEVELCIYY